MGFLTSGVTPGIIPSNNEMEVSENQEALIVLAGTVAGAATFVASLPIPLEIKAPATALVSTVTGAILLYWKSKVNKQ